MYVCRASKKNKSKKQKSTEPVIFRSRRKFWLRPLRAVTRITRMICPTLATRERDDDIARRHVPREGEGKRRKLLIDSTTQSIDIYSFIHRGSSVAVLSVALVLEPVLMSPGCHGAQGWPVRRMVYAIAM